MADTNEKVVLIGALRTLAEQMNVKIKAAVSVTYHPGGSASFADLPELTEGNSGLLINVTDAFTTTADFVDGEGKEYPAGTNVAIVKSGETYKYDAMSGFVNLSGFVEKEDGKGLSSNDFTDADKTKLDGISEGATKVEKSETPGCVKINGVDVQVVEIASDAEVRAMLAEVFGTAEA